MYQTDIVIIGAGPVGLFTVFQAGMLGMETHIIDALDFVGGQCMALYPDKMIYDIPAYHKISGRDLIHALQKQAAPFAPQFHLGQNVMDISGDAVTGFTVTTSKITVQAKAIIIAAGAGLFEPRKPPIKGLSDFEGTSVFYAISDKKAMQDKNIVIAGGGDSAVDWAIDLSDIAKSVHLIHRRETFRAFAKSLEILYEKIEAGRITLHKNAQLADISGKDGRLKKVVLRNMTGQENALDADILLPFFGLKHNLSYLEKWGLSLEKGGVKVTQHNAQSNLRGIYAVGDISAYPNKLKLILAGFSEAASAVHDAYPLVFSGKSLHFEHSTTKGETLCSPIN